MNQKNKKIEMICWYSEKKEGNLKKFFRFLSKEVCCAVGFVIDEDDVSVTISTTESFGKYIDIMKIQKVDIGSRKFLGV